MSRAAKYLIITSMAIVQCTIFPNARQTIVENEGFLSYIIPSGPNFGQIKHCSVETGTKTYELDSGKAHIIDPNTILNRFSKEQCGIRVMNVSKALQGIWTIMASDSRGIQIADTLTLTVNVKKSGPSVMNVTAQPGSSFVRFACPNKDFARYCRIYDWTNKIVSAECEGLFDLKDKNNVYKCRTLIYGDMQEIETMVYVIVPEIKKPITATLIETDTHFIARCQSTQKLWKCRASPEKSDQQLQLDDGLLTQRYSSYDTNLAKGICSLEIEKPLIPTDKDVWRIYGSYSFNDYTGCIFQIGVNKNFEPIPNQNIQVYHDQSRPTTTTTILSCEAPYEIEYCYLQRPNGNGHTPLKFDRLKYLGRCEFEVKNITSGIWACGFNDNQGNEDHLTYYDVTVFEKPAQVISNSLKGNIGDINKKLLCKTILNMPLSACRFTTPNGVVHGLFEDTKPSETSNFQYYGKGLANGECGIEIKKLRQEDIGQWMCTFSVSQNEYTLKIQMEKEALSTAGVIGITLGVIVVSSLGVAIFIYKKYFYNVRRYNTPRMSEISRSDSLDSHNS